MTSAELTFKQFQQRKTNSRANTEISQTEKNNKHLPPTWSHMGPIIFMKLESDFAFTLSPLGLACVIQADSTVSGLIKDCNSLPPWANASTSLSSGLLCLSGFVFQPHGDFSAVILATDYLSTENKSVSKPCGCSITGNFRSEKGWVYNASKYPSGVCAVCNTHMPCSLPEQFGSGFRTYELPTKMLPLSIAVNLVCNSLGNFSSR